MDSAVRHSDAEKEQALIDRLRTLGSLAVAFSGGLDSRFLIHEALRAGLSVRALHAAGPHIPAAEHRAALAWAAGRGVPLAVVPLDPLAMPALRNNPRDRCYHCKKAVFAALKQAAGEIPLADGTNASDSEGYRPGLKALAELGVISPLADAGLDKKAIRALAAATGMDNPGQAALPCLLTRFNYGLAVTPEKLAALDAAEQAVERVLRAHRAEAPGFRLRWLAPQKAALHLAVPALDPALARMLRTILAEHGFAGVPVETVPELSGYFDRE